MVKKKVPSLPPHPRCAWGWNDQDPRTHSTNGHLAEATNIYWVRFNPAIVLAVDLCKEHYEEVRKENRWLLTRAPLPSEPSSPRRLKLTAREVTRR